MFEQTLKNVDNLRHKDADCTSELDYSERWIIQHELPRWGSWVALKTALPQQAFTGRLTAKKTDQRVGAVA